MPQLHSHFFTPTGSFGSLDQFQNQVDDGTYVIVDSNNDGKRSGTPGIHHRQLDGGGHVPRNDMEPGGLSGLVLARPPVEA